MDPSFENQQHDTLRRDPIALGCLPVGYGWRPLTPADLEAVYELEAAGEAFDDGQVEIDLSDLQGDWLRPDFHLDTMSVGVFDGTGLVAYATVFNCRAEALVHPSHRAIGLGSALMRWTWEVARFDGCRRVGQTVSENERAAAHLFESAGYQATHTSWILTLELGSGRRAPIVLPAGYRFRAYRPEVDDHELFSLIDRAFDEWREPGSTPMTFENWVVWALHDIDPALVIMVEHCGHLVGAVLGHDYGSDQEGWIEELAVAKEHRDLGLGRALLEACFSGFQERGHLLCGISTDSRTGALTLYEHLGMTVRKTYTHWSRQL